ncbi:MAG: tetratricopeptide repeat protein [Candidatus Hydrogenedens sp.]|nr:tetratricopeptide repeat protein [Candidatus Hydrogenedens sp.]
MDTQPPYAFAERLLRAGIIAFLVFFVPAVYIATDGPATDIKWLLIAWSAAALTVGWLVAVWRLGLPIKRPPLFSPILAVLLIVLAAAVAHSEFRWLGIQFLSRMLLLTTLYFICSQVVHTTEHIRAIFRWTCGIMLLVSGYAFLQAAGLDPLQWDKTAEVYQNLPGTFGHPNFAAHALLFVIVYAAYLAATGHRWGFLYAPAFLIYLSATGQRAGWIALAGAVALLAAAWIAGRLVKRPASAAITAIAVTALIGVAGLGSAMALNYVRNGNLFPMDHSLLLRYQSYVGAGDMFFDHPILGHGPDVYGVKNPVYWTPFEQEWFAKERLMNLHVHNDLMEFGIDGGMLAAGCYLALLITGIFASLLVAYRARERDDRLLGFTFAAVFAAFAIDGLFGFNIRVPVSAAFFFLAMGMLDGLWTARHAPPPVAASRADAFRWAIAGLVGVCAIFESRAFSAEYDLHQGIVAAQTGQPRQAKEYFDTAYRKAPWNWQIQRQMGHLALASGDYAEALQHFERVFEINPYNLLSRLPMAQTRMLRAQQQLASETGGAAAALEELNEGTAGLELLLQRCPMEPRAHEMIGRIETASGLIAAQQPENDANMRALEHWRKAEYHIEQAIKDDLDVSDELYRMLAEVRISLGDIMGAEKALSESVRRDPHNLAAWPGFLQFAATQQRYDQARNALGAQIRLLREEDPIDNEALATAWLVMANIQENGYKNLPEAETAYNNAIALRPDRMEVWVNFARFAMGHGRVEALKAALLQADAAASSAPNIALPEPVQAVLLYLKDGVPKLELASEVLLSVVRSADDRPYGFTPQEAHGWAVDLLEDGARNGLPERLCRVWFNLALCRNALAQYESARGWLEKAETCLPDELRGALAVHWADTLVGLKETTRALLRLEEAIEADPANLELRWAYARTLARIGLADRAREEYQKLLAEPDIESLGREMLQKELEQLP